MFVQGARPLATTRTYGTTSSPESAQGPSAESGGSRGKQATEEHQESRDSAQDPRGGNVLPDGLAEGDVRGRTGGGEPLDSSRAAPPQPKIYNASVHAGTADLTKEQKAEVDAHNREFEDKHGRGVSAGEDKVNKGFWSGKGSRMNIP